MSRIQLRNTILKSEINGEIDHVHELEDSTELRTNIQINETEQNIEIDVHFCGQLTFDKDKEATGEGQGKRTVFSTNGYHYGNKMNITQKLTKNEQIT